MFQRFRRLRNRDPDFSQHLHHLGESLLSQSDSRFHNWDPVKKDKTDDD